MRTICYILFIICCSIGLAAQQAGSHPIAIDEHAKNAPKSLGQDLPALTNYLITPAETDYEKVRAFYVWIITHISYDRAAAEADKRRNHSIADVLRSRKAICYGYAQLFQAMCEKAGLQSTVVHGYAREDGLITELLTTPNHSWNAVLLDGKWYLLDATWGAGSLIRTGPIIDEVEDAHFLPPARKFVQSRLPGDPTWQLLPHPVPPKLFFEAATSIPEYLATPDSTYHYVDSIAWQFTLPPSRRRLLFYERAYRFYPTSENAGQLGHGLIDYAGILADTVEQSRLRQEDPQYVISLNAQVIDLCRQAAQLTDLYDWQHELYISALINQGVDLYNLPTEAHEIMQHRYLTILSLFQEAQARLEKAENSYFTQMARQQCAQYIEVVTSYIAE